MGRKNTAWSFFFIEDVLEVPDEMEIFGGESAKESALLYAVTIQKGDRGTWYF